MKVSRKELNHMDQKANVVTMIAVEKEFIVPDTKEDVGSIIYCQSSFVLKHMEALSEKVKISGLISFRLLYVTEGEELSSLEGTVPFEDVIHVDHISAGDVLEGSLLKEDVKFNVLHSRKLSVQAIMRCQVICQEQTVKNCICEIEEGEDIDCQKKKLFYTVLAAKRQEAMYLEQELSLPQNKPNAERLLWQRMSLVNVDVKPVDGELVFRGELTIFLIYESEGEDMPLQYLLLSAPFHESIEDASVMADSCVEVNCNLRDTKVLLNPDEDGEQRILSVHATLVADYRVYEEKEDEIVLEMYAPSVELHAKEEDLRLKKLCMHNNAKTKLVERIRVEEEKAILQICDTAGEVTIDEVTNTPQGIMVQGIVSVDILYISKENNVPISCLATQIPFSHEIAIDGERVDLSQLKVTPSIENISVIMLDSEEIELRATVMIDVLAFEARTYRAISELEVAPIDFEKRSALPAMCGYVVQEGDTLWSVAKRFYASIDDLKRVNELENEELSEGQMLLIISPVL